MLIVTNINSNNECFFNFHSYDELAAENAKKRYKELSIKLEDIFKNKENYKQIVVYYWNLGTVIRNFIIENKIKKDYFYHVFESARSIFDSIDSEFVKDSSKRKRNMAHHFYVLAGYSLDNVTKTSWSTWTYLFQNIYLNEIDQLHIFLEKKLSEGVLFKEGFLRVFIMLANQLFYKINLSSWSTREILIPIKISYSITNKVSKLYDLDNRILRKEIVKYLKSILKNNYKKFLNCFSEESLIIEFESIVIDEINSCQ